jgi:tRNA G18 (ribose-2'-O)-methylase SpoU
MILRIAEAYQFNVSILDQGDVLGDPEKLSTVRDFGCGAMSRRSFRKLANPAELAKLRPGRRLIATTIGSDALSLKNFHFQPGDLIVMGNEYDGLPDEVATSADVRLYVPIPASLMPKEKSHSPIDPSRIAPVSRAGQLSLNVAVTAGIVCYAAYTQWLGGQ